MLKTVVGLLGDESDLVKFSAAAAVIRLGSMNRWRNATEQTVCAGCVAERFPSLQENYGYVPALNELIHTATAFHTTTGRDRIRRP